MEAFLRVGGQGRPPSHRGDDVGQAEALYPSALTG